jgi:hypothetical protein
MDEDSDGVSLEHELGFGRFRADFSVQVLARILSRD